MQLKMDLISNKKAPLSNNVFHFCFFCLIFFFKLMTSSEASQMKYSELQQYAQIFNIQEYIWPTRESIVHTLAQNYLLVDSQKQRLKSSDLEPQVKFQNSFLLFFCFTNSLNVAICQKMSIWVTYF